jgi:ethanolamine utilization protein EutQ (cupin superfamily)
LLTAPSSTSSGIVKIHTPTEVRKEGRAMSKLEAKRFDQPDEVRPFTGHGHVDLVELSTGPVGLGTFEPGWKWSNDVKPLAGTESCQVGHIGYCVSGRMSVRMDDGTVTEISPGTVFQIPPGHDGWTEGDEACVLLDFGGLSSYALSAT